MESRNQISRKSWSYNTVTAFLSALYITISIGVLILDRVTKLYALEHFGVEQKVFQFLSFELVINRGISWGILNSSSTFTFLCVVLLTLLVTCALGIYAYRRILQGYTIVGELLVFTGSLSNILDRVLYNGVVDFILVHIQSWSWPVFNIADSAIVLGVVCMMIQLIKQQNA